MNRKPIQKILDDIFFGTKLELIEGNTKEAQDIADSFSPRAKEILSLAKITFPNEDLAFLAGTYMLSDEANRNTHRVTEQYVMKALDTLLFKASNINHQRSNPIGFYIDATYDNGTKSMKSYALIWKAQFPTEYAKIQEWIAMNDAGQSFELTYGEGIKQEDGTTDLKNICFRGGAFLQRSKAACDKTDYVILASQLDNLVCGGIKEDNIIMDKSEILVKLEIKDMAEADILKLDEEISKLDVASKKEVVQKAKSLGLTNLVEKHKSGISFTWDEVSEIEEAVMVHLRKVEDTLKEVRDKDKTTSEQLTKITEEYTTAKTQLAAKEVFKYTEEDIKKAVIETLARDKKLRERREEIKADVTVKDEDLLDDVKFETMKKDKQLREETAKKEEELKNLSAERDLYKQKLTEAGISIEVGKSNPPIGGITPTPKEDTVLASMKSKTVK